MALACPSGARKYLSYPLFAMIGSRGCQWIPQGALRGVSQQGSRLTSRATPLGTPNGVNGDTNGDTFRVAKQVRRCQNLREIQANTMDNPLSGRANNLINPYPLGQIHITPNVVLVWRFNMVIIHNENAH